MSLSDEERLAIVTYRIEKARLALDEINNRLSLSTWLQDSLTTSR